MATKSITFKGVNRASAQSEAPDGACQEIMNLRYRKGCWRPVGPKEVIGSSVFMYSGNPITMTAIYLHDIEGGVLFGEPNWLGYEDSGETGNIYLIDRTDFDNPTLTLIVSSLNISHDFPLSITFLKRFMLITTASGIQMYLWTTDKTYARVESLPVPAVELHKNNIFLVDYPTFLETETDDANPGSGNAAALLGNYFDVINTQSSTEGRLYGSLMYITVYRLFDGSYILPTIPRYFEISNDGILIKQNKKKAGNYSSWMKFTVAGIRASIDNTLYPAELSAIKDLVDSVCIFTTRVTPLHQINEVTLADPKFSTEPFNYPPQGSGNAGTMKSWYFGSFFPINPDFGKMAASEGWFKVHEFVFDTLVAGTGRTFADVDTKNYYQNYSTNLTLPADQFSYHNLVAKVAYTYNDRLHAANVKTLYGDPYVLWPKFRSDYDMDGVDEGVSAGKAIVWLKTGLGNAIVVSDITIPAYSPATTTIEVKASKELAEARVAYLNANPGSVSGYVPGSAHYLKKTVPSGFTAVSITGIGNPSATSGYPYVQGTNAETHNIYYRVDAAGSAPYLIPSVIGYNDSRAYRMAIVLADGTVLLDTPLKKNIGMNFAYYHSESFTVDNSAGNYRDLLTAGGTLAITIPEAIETPFDSNRIQVSEIQNPLIYPAANSYQVGTGNIIALAAGSEPLSTGQFGQFPLQVFTSKGIWALEIGSGAVLYSNILPVNGEVADNAKNIISLMGGVLYSTEKGLFIIFGRNVTELSEIVEGVPDAFNQSTEMVSLCTVAKFTPNIQGAVQEVDFIEYLNSNNCHIGYDQVNKELIVTKSTDGYPSFIYSFESKLWTTVGRTYELLINSWPRLYGVDSESIYDLSSETTGNVETMIISCAQSFEMPGLLKKIERMLLRCDVTTPEGQYAGLYLFGSDDLVTWKFITGKQRTGTKLKDLLLQRSHGTAKYYKIVFNGCISTDSEVKHIDLSYVAKWNSKLR